MTRAGLTIESDFGEEKREVRAELTLANTGVGHAFPTYVTPRVIVEIGQADGEGNPIAATLESHRIARDVSLDLATELADTRLMPDESRRYRYQRPRDPTAQGVFFRIRVQPDAFYAEFYRAVWDDPDYAPGQEALREALRQAEASPYVLFRQYRPFR